MNLSGKKIVIFAIVVFLIVVWIWPSNNFKVKNIEDGNTMVMTNGTTVRLLGVSSTEEGKGELESLKGKKVELVSDEMSFFETNRLDKNSVVYAYVLLPDYDFECINATLLKKGYATLVENCVDSLKNFQKYVAKGGKKNITPTPTPVEPIDYAENDIVLPQYVTPTERKYSAWYSDGNMNVEMLEEACDFNLPYTKSFANELAACSAGDYASVGIEQVCEIFDYCYKKWRYVSDPAEQEYVARASESIAASLTGDCDDFAILLSSCILAIGGNVRITTAYTETSGHAFAELDITEMDKHYVLETINKRFGERVVNSLATKSEGGRVWLNLDWQASYPGGRYWNYSERSVYSRQGREWKWDGRFSN